MRFPCFTVAARIGRKLCCTTTSVSVCDGNFRCPIECKTLHGFKTGDVLEVRVRNGYISFHVNGKCASKDTLKETRALSQIPTPHGFFWEADGTGSAIEILSRKSYHTAVEEQRQSLAAAAGAAGLQKATKPASKQRSKQRSKQASHK
eukprot:TRINITY_DN7417_c0_g1_i1.p2 TRINITY_DN7417_c0_g1~~TRINITY_DN7417_c0_g1_i1.p2  ORF type:complete len:148 (-),score=16.00 TRINITY_DN7417_c0_g1_i1:11-454(-)